jgi:sugar diacid utilization regulator
MMPPGTWLCAPVEELEPSYGESSEAADRLLLHRNSIPYRLERVRELTGLDFRDYRANLAIQLGLLAIDKEEADETEHP